jgi:transcriptional regulator with XRE-family HTH domain
MTPDRFRACLIAIGWTQRGLASLLQMDERQVRRWASGATIPSGIAEWLETLARQHEKHPPPVRRLESTK